MADAVTSEATSGDPGSSVDNRRRPPARRSSTRGVVEWVAILAAAALVAFVLQRFVVQAFYIPSGSMETTLVPGDRVLVNKLSHDVHRGDIVVFTKPASDTTPNIKDLIKRVVGLPGEQISSGPSASVLINGRPISEPWLTATARANPGPAITPQVIPPGDYFMMGDNRGDSADSRIIGPVPGRLIVGRAFVRVWPFSNIRSF
ncbi:MAG: signal peptidase I [Actinomycetota bacterium]|nr:signal peptidase I [Actinomycetota bacterium]